MTWWARNARWFQEEVRELENNSDYRQLSQASGITFVSSGNVIVRTDKIHKFPVLIVYPNATPYVPPIVYLLSEPASEEEAVKYSNMPDFKIGPKLKDRIKIYYHRHQNVYGSLCILEADDLHSERAEVVGARATIARVRDWCRGVLTGRFPKDSREVELFHHFHNHADLELLLSDSFYDGSIVEGRFYFHRSDYLKDHIYFGVGITGKRASGIEVSSFEDLKKNRLLQQYEWDITELERRTEKVIDAINERNLIEGLWWEISEEPTPFKSMSEFASLLDKPGACGEARLFKAIGDKVRRSTAEIYVGVRFPGRHSPYDWALFRLVRDEGAFPLNPTEQDLIAEMHRYQIQAIRTEQITEDYFHLRNQGRAERNVLKDKGITILGAGALGSTLATHMAKAGIGKLHVVDKGELRAHNVIRHECNMTQIGDSKADAVGLYAITHNPFIDIQSMPIDIVLLNDRLWNMIFPQDFVGVSSIADDNVEAWLNEVAVRSSREVFYVRALRGGKAARIFRVRPGIDACKECLALYHADDHPDFLKVSEDETLPVLTNECNNPVRPGSSADLVLIASLASRIVLEAQQGKEMGQNHWIWITEELPGLMHEPSMPFALHQRFLGPHPQCRLCQKSPIKKVLITEDAHQKVVGESRDSGKLETGGVLVGFFTDDGNAVITDASAPGPNAERKSDSFKRDVEFCQQFLVDSRSDMGDRGCYVGEWHYHPTGTNNPSSRDLLSMLEISRQSNYETDHPVSLILSPSLQLGATIHFPNGSHEKVEIEIVSSEHAAKLVLQQCI